MESTIIKADYLENDYLWIWDEFSNAPGDLEGNDVENWGSSLGPYHNRTELWDKINSLEMTFPELIDVESIGFSYQGVPIPLVVLTDETVTTQKKEFFIVAHHHAREMITIENALYYLDKIVYDFISGDTEIEYILQTREIYVIPSLNIDSLDYMHLLPGLRKNLRPVDEDGDGTDDEIEILVGKDTFDLDQTIGEDLPGGIDLNRNYDYQWDFAYGNSPINSSLVYRGEKPFSEPETKALADFVRKHYFQSAVSLHSGVELILVPWGFDPSLPCPDEALFTSIANKLVQLTGLGFQELYPAAGVWDDWMYAVRGTVALTLETYSAPGPEWQNIWDGFNPHANQVIENCEEVAYPGLLYMTKYNRPDLAIEPIENITSLLIELTEQSGLNLISIPISLVFTTIIILIRRRKK